ncbi:hypothetical protein [Gulosibacter sp. 10]|uniref:hypothetical protein n=1 Tax=Gulosibacter sp. 10 TaxID=1255570 RepID=UPI00097E9CF9|nr:hypothetical protein [Gulosibacter sp. 10]SJM71776.1 hypothetical protein FM112_16845 [Gulosibacter sp. 10]
MSRRAKSLTPPSPILPPEQVDALLIDLNGELGALGGSFGRGPWAAAGGRSGGRLGAKLFTRIVGDSRELRLPLSPDSFVLVRDSFRTTIEADLHRGLAVGIVPSGALSMNPAVVQARWRGADLLLTAHANEGLIGQRTAERALDHVEETIRTAA